MDSKEKLDLKETKSDLREAESDLREAKSDLKDGVFRSEKKMPNSEEKISEWEEKRPSAREQKKVKGKKDFSIEGETRSKVAKGGKRIFILIVSNFIMALSLSMFAESANLLPAGFSGLTILLQKIFETKGVALPFGPVYIAFNILPAVMAYKMVGKKFVLLSFLSVVLFSGLVDVLPIFQITDQIILSVVFGAVMYGGGIALLMRANASAGGTDFIAVSLSEKYGINFFPYTFLLNAAILACSIPYFGVDAALYSVLYQFLCTVVLSQFYSRYQRVTLLIITDKPDLISNDLMRMTRHGVTSIEAKGMYTGNKKYILYMVVAKDDVTKVKKYLNHTDASIFMNVLKSDQLEGNFFMQPYE